MHRPSRARRTLKWTAAGLSLVILPVWVASLFFKAQTLLGNHCYLAVSRGVICLGFADYAASVFSQTAAEKNSSIGFGIELPRAGTGSPLFNNVREINIPFWILLLFTAILTAWLWHRDRRRTQPGCCLRCGYNLAGNTSGVCSECGEKTTSIAEPPSRQGRA